MRKTIVALIGTGALIAAITGCAPGSGGSPATSTTAPISKNLGSKPITIKVSSTPESGALAKAAIPGFERKYPNVKVEYAETNFDDYNTNLNLDLASDTPPDVVLLNAVGNTVKNGLVRPLDDYAKLYNWSKVYPETQLAQWRVGEDGTTLGSGSLYAAPAGFSIVGAYYNKALFTQLGVDKLPTTLDEFNADLAAAKSKGLLPLQLGNSQGHAAFPVQLVGQSIDGASAYAKWVFGHNGATFETPGNTTGLEQLTDWAKKGYIPASANGTDLQGAVDAFTKGKGVFFVDGNWDAGKIDQAMGDGVGFITFPGKTVTGIGTSVAYSIATHSAHQDAAAAFLNYLNSADAGVFQFESGFIPVNPDKVQATGVRKEIVDAFQQVGKANGLVGFDAGATSTMNDTLTQVTQELIGGKTTVPDAITRIQADWHDTHGK